MNLRSASLEGSDYNSYLVVNDPHKSQCFKSFISLATHDPVGPAMALLFGGSGEKLTAQFQGTKCGDGGRGRWRNSDI